MSSKSFGREFAEEVICKAMSSAAPIAAGIILGPAGGVAIAALGAAIIITSSGSNSGSSAPTGSNGAGSSS